MPDIKNSKYKTVKKTVKTAGSSNPAQVYYGVHLITASKINTANKSRLMSPIEAERRKSLLMTGTHSGTSSIRKMRKPTKKLSLKPAPAIPTAPKSKAEIRKNFIKTTLKKYYDLLDKKLFGVYKHKKLVSYDKLLKGTDDRFFMPHSRHTTVYEEDIKKCKDLVLLANSKEAGATGSC